MNHLGMTRSRIALCIIRYIQNGHKCSEGQHRRWHGMVRGRNVCKAADDDDYGGLIYRLVVLVGM